MRYDVRKHGDRPTEWRLLEVATARLLRSIGDSRLWHEEYALARASLPENWNPSVEYWIARPASDADSALHASSRLYANLWGPCLTVEEATARRGAEGQIVLARFGGGQVKTYDWDEAKVDWVEARQYRSGR